MTWLDKYLQAGVEVETGKPVHDVTEMTKFGSGFGLAFKAL